MLQAARSHRFAAGAGIVATLMGGFAAWPIACGPFLTDLDTVTAVRPANEIAFTRGEIGVVRPHLARRYLVHAYRTLSGRPASVREAADIPHRPSNVKARRWWSGRRCAMRFCLRIHESTRRRLCPTCLASCRPPTRSFANCADDAFANAVRTARARSDRFGAQSAALREWAAAQEAVFANCSSETLVLPAVLADTADPLLRADRAYQTAAAYFYALQYDEAARRFRAIGDDRSSPWRPYGRYLAARATIRSATVPEVSGAEANARLEGAKRELEAVLADPAAASLHRSARGLIGFVDFRLHLVARVHEISARLATAPAIDGADLDEYRRLMDRAIGDTVAYDYDRVKDRDALIAGDDLTDWVLAMQDGRDAAAPRALARWQETKSTPWLVAALWTLPPDHASAGAVLDAAQAIDRSSPAFQTVAFLRVRLLAAAGRLEDARAALASLPDAPAPGFQAETVNLLRAERLMLARTLEEFLAAAPRAIVGARNIDTIASGTGLRFAEIRSADLRRGCRRDAERSVAIESPGGRGRLSFAAEPPQSADRHGRVLEGRAPAARRRRPGCRPHPSGSCADDSRRCRSLRECAKRRRPSSRCRTPAAADAWHACDGGTERKRCDV